MHWSLLVLLLLTTSLQGQQNSPDCPGDWLLLGDSCYLFSSKALSWQDAKLSCEVDQAKLVSVNNLAEHTFINNRLNNLEDASSRSDWYTGGNMPANGDSFVWLDGGAVNLPKWKDPGVESADAGNYIIYTYFDDTVTQEYKWARDDGAQKLKYICEISTTDASSITSKDRDFVFGLDNAHPDEIYRGPFVVEEPQSIQFPVSADDDDCAICDPSGSFSCVAGGYPQPEIEWFSLPSNSQAMPGNVVNALSYDYITITNDRLTIHEPFRHRTSDAYYCRITNQFGTVVSEAATIRGITLVEFPRTDRTVTAYINTYFTLPCTYPGNERYQYSWFLNGDPNNFVNSEYNAHIFISFTGKLYFQTITNSDAADYYCKVSLFGQDSGESRISGTRTIRTLYREHVSVEPVMFDEFPLVVPSQPKKGDTVFLECVARYTSNTGHVVDYQWRRKDGRSLGEDYILDGNDYNRKLQIPNVGFDDEGVYICSVSVQNEGSDEGEVTLSIIAKPYFGDGGLRNEHRDIGTTFTWTCIAQGKPLPTYSWLKNGKSLSPEAGRISFSDNMRSVTFQSLDPERDDGMYQCAARNSEGTTYSTAQLRVLSFRPSFVKHPELGQVLTTVGGNATIPCEPEAAPKADLDWSKNGQTAQGRKLSNGFWFIDQVTRGDAGSYMCKATNSLGTSNVSIPLLVLDKTEVRNVDAPVDGDYLVGSQVTLNCRAYYDRRLDLLYQWEHNNRVIDFDDWKMSQIYSRGVGVDRGDLIIKSVTYEERGSYRCRAVTQSDEDSKQAQVDVHGPPAEPAGLKASDADSKSVLLTWKQGTNNGDAIRGYIIEQYNSDTRIWVLSKNGNVSLGAQTSYKVDGLFASTTYKFRLYAFNMYGPGVGSLESNLITTLGSPPTSYPRGLGGGGGKTGTLVITWTPLPKEEWNGVGLEYIVRFRAVDNTETAINNWEKCVIRHPTPTSEKCVKLVGSSNFYRRYNVAVQAKNNDGEGPISPIQTIYSAVGLPTKSPDGTASQPYNATALVVYWDPIDNSRAATGGEVKGFHIKYWKVYDDPEMKDYMKRRYGRRAEIPGNASVTQGMVIGLEPNTEYSVSVQVWNTAGDSPEGEDQKQTTWMKAPSNMPEYVYLNRSASNLLGVQFNGVVTEKDEEPLDGYKVRIWRSGDSLRNVTDYDCGRKTSIVIDNTFEPAPAVYNLRVFGYSRGGVGKMSSPLIQFSYGCSKSTQVIDPDVQMVYLCDGCNTKLSFTILLVALTFQIIKHIL